MTDQPMSAVTACDGCGQIRAVTGTEQPGEVLCRDCLGSLYGGCERHAAERLFTPAPAPMAGQESMALE